MVEFAYELACLKELDAMIGRAVAACDRYRQATEHGGLPAPLRRKRLQAPPDSWKPGWQWAIGSLKGHSSAGGGSPGAKRKEEGGRSPPRMPHGISKANLRMYRTQDAVGNPPVEQKGAAEAAREVRSGTGPQAPGANRRVHHRGRRQPPVKGKWASPAGRYDTRCHPASRSARRRAL